MIYKSIRQFYGIQSNTIRLYKVSLINTFYAQLFIHNVYAHSLSVSAVGVKLYNDNRSGRSRKARKKPKHPAHARKTWFLQKSRNKIPRLLHDNLRSFS